MEFSLVSMWHSMGVPAKGVVVTLAVMSVYSLSVMVERLYAYSRARRQSRDFAGSLRELLPAGQLEAAAKRADALPFGHVSRVLGAGLVEYNNGRAHMANLAPGEAPFDMIDTVNRAIERNALRVNSDLRKGLGALATIGSTAPFVGLLGTVLGIVNAFQSMAATGNGGLASVSGGISEALITTAFGLLVAIPAVMMFNYLTNQVEEMTVDITDASSELVDFFLKENASQKRVGWNLALQDGPKVSPDKGTRPPLPAS